jgi:hypothetical protein
MVKIFEMRTDHSGLKYLFGHPSLNSRQRKWLEFLSEYNFDIKHIKGKQNKVVDALNRRLQEIHATTISMYRSGLSGEILEVSKSNQHYMDIKVNLQQGMSQKKLKGYELKEDGILMYSRRVYVLNVQKLKILLL